MRNRWTSVLSSVLTLVLVSATAGPAWSQQPAPAQPPPGAAPAAGTAAAPAAGAAATASDSATDEARQHYENGVNLYNDGDYKVALVEFAKAYEIQKNYRVLYNVGQVNFQLNRYAKALRAFQQYLADGGEEVPEERRASVEKDIATLKNRVAYLTIDSNVDKVQVRIDDEVAGTTRLSDFLVDVGPHNIVLTKEGFKQRNEQVTVAGREARVLDYPLQKEEPKIVVEHTSGVPAYVWVGWGVTAALGVGTLTSGLLTNGAANDLEAARKRATTSSELKSLGDKKDNLTVLTIVLGGATIASAGVSLFLTLTSGSSKEKTTVPAQKTGLHLAPGLGGFVAYGAF